MNQFDLMAKLGTLTGRPRRALYLRLKAEQNAERRAARRLPTPHAEVIRGMRTISLLPAPWHSPAAVLTSGAERRHLRNVLKAMRKRHRA